MTTQALRFRFSICLLFVAHCFCLRGVDSAAAETARPPRAAVFRATGFPTADAPPIDDATLAAALAGLSSQTLDSPAALSSRLKRAEHDVLLLTYGSAFPSEAWPAIRDFVREGGGLVVLGGAPFHQPVRRSGDAYVLGSRQPTYARELLIGPAQEIDVAAFAGPRASVVVEGTGWTRPLPEPRRTWALTIRLTSTKDSPGEDGSAGPRDGVVRPLVHVRDGLGLARACPLLEIDRLRGPGAGGRWVLAPTDAVLPVETIRAAVERALQASVEISARPIRAAVDPGEPVRIRVSVGRPGARAGETPATRARVSVRDDAGQEVAASDVELLGPAEVRTGIATLAAGPAFRPGLYHAMVEVPGVAWSPRTTETGFWVKDAALLASGPRLSVSRDWLRRDGRVAPIVGTTYMASDVHRKFLFEPNPHAWDRDFAAMKQQGIGMVRTGLWTAWSRAMLDPGALDENVLSALDAYVLSAAKHGILVCFNFYAFLPPSFGDTNPYLGPRALEGQRAFLTALGSRYRGVSWVHWDLINEPSYAPPESLWSNQPIRDGPERKAWTRWAREKHGDDLALLRDLWRDAGDDLFELPRPDELRYAFLREHRRPRKTRDFGEFSQWAVAGWARRLREILKAAGGDVLVTLGQDEGGTADRPAQSIYFDSLDYTAVHTWWNNDDLLWDGVVTKSPELPNLHQETGLMSLHDKDGFAWRTPEAAARLLERKFAYAFAGRGAGVIQWAWNINPYMPVENEATIGFLRPDGTAKPELRVVRPLAEFFRTAAPYLDDFAPDPVVLVVPHSRVFMGRPGGADATKRVVRLLAERFGVVPTALSEIRLSPERLRDAKLVLLPAPEVLEENAAGALLAATKAGAKLLVTGAVEGDSYGRATASLQALGIVDAGRPLALHEPTPWGTAGSATFEGLAQERMRRAGKPSLVALTGAVWHEPLPLEFAREPEPLVALLGDALRAAGIETHPGSGGVAARILVAPKAVLVVVVNETPDAARRTLKVEGRRVVIPVAAMGARLALFERRSGRLVATTPGEPLSD
ncbi:MAG TPA: hypothetical protein VJ648_01590 [Vicinamibacteria bacterium]|nr:hypothetical protein [Vicinamibacteria bacterium]